MNSLQCFIHKELENKSLLLMTHVVYGYPSVAKSLEIMQLMLDKGVELLEVQFPFSDPVADGPVITTACHHALEQAPKLSQCLKDLGLLAANNPQSRVLLMSYLNPLLQISAESLANKMQGIAGLIIPDLPIEQAGLMAPLSDHNIAVIWIVTPDMTEQRIQMVTSQAVGMLYCVSRSGVTGKGEKVSGIQQYLERARAHTTIPLGVGFGINALSDIASMKGHADIAIVGSAFIQAFDNGGMSAVCSKLDELSLTGYGCN